MYCGSTGINRAVASLMVPGGQEFHFPHFSSKFDKFDLFFPPNFLIFFLSLALQVGNSSTREGPGYATGYKYCQTNDVNTNSLEDLQDVIVTYTSMILPTFSFLNCRM